MNLAMTFALRISVLLVSAVALANAACTNDPPPSNKWCYHGADCGPTSDKWSLLCREGKQQTPIDLPRSLYPTGRFSLRLQGYKSSSFQLTNNGHSVAVNFAKDGATGQPFPFPDPLLVSNLDPSRQNIRKFILDHAHFHWGRNDSFGSEHCIGGRCAAMEMHLVHYNATYSSVSEALKSCDDSALSVLGILFVVSRNANANNSPLKPIVSHLAEVKNYGDSRSYSESIDLSQYFQQSGNNGMLTYKGSLTTPGCNEQVNWFVLNRPVAVSSAEMDVFRSAMTDSHGEKLVDNYRPLQARNNRRVLLSDVYNQN